LVNKQISGTRSEFRCKGTTNFWNRRSSYCFLLYLAKKQTINSSKRIFLIISYCIKK